MFKKISFIAVLLIFFIINKSFALTFEGTDGYTYIVSDDNILERVFILEKGNNIVIFTFDGIPSYYRTETSGYITVRGDCTESGFYRNITLSKSTNTVKSNTDFPVGSFFNYSIDLNTLIYINFDVVDSKGNIIIESTEKKDKFELNLTVEPSNITTDVPVLIHSQSISIDNILKYNLEYSLDNEKWESCNVRSITDTNNNTVCQFYHEVYKNQLIYFRFKNIETNEFIYETVNIDNIIFNQDSYNNYIDGVFSPTPFLSYEYISDNLITITTQKFFEEEIKKIECSYIKYTNSEDFNNNDLWLPVNVRSFYDPLTKDSTYQFYFDIDNTDCSADGNYFVRFYNKDTKEYTYSSINVLFQNIIDYHESISKVNTRLDVFLDFFKDRLGFLTYPFELIINFLERMLYIKFEEPVIRVPDIKEPFTGVKLISAIDFNFNDLLENETLKNVHDIYLIFVDAIIILGLVNLARIKLMEVFVK